MHKKLERPGLRAASTASILRAGGLGLAAAVACLVMPHAAAQAPAGAGADGDAGDEEIVIVTGSLVPVPRRQVATAVSVISGEEIELRGLNSFADVMRTQPAIGVSNNGGVGKSTTLRIRGEEGYRTTLMIDGIKALDPSGPQASPNFDALLTTSDLERVEVLRGPQGFIYGADAGGVVNILTRRGDGPAGGRVGVEEGQFGTRKLDGSVSGGNDTTDYFFSVTDLETDGFNARPSDSVLRDDDGAENTTLHAKIGWNAGENLRLQLVARDIDSSSLFDGCFHPVDFVIVHDCVASNEQTIYRLSADQSSERFSNSIGYGEMEIERGNFAAGLSSFGSSGNLSRLEYTGSFEANEATTLVYGLDLQTEDAFANGAPQERDQDGYYFEYQGDFNDRVFVSVGARYDDNDDFGSATSERASLAYVQELDSGRAIKYRTSYGTGFRAPSLFEVSYNGRPFGVLPAAAATQLTEETSEGYDIGIEYTAAGGLRLEATYFDHEIDNQIEYASAFDPDTGFFDGYIQTPGISESTGVELVAVVPVGDRVEVSMNWTDNDTQDAEGNPRARRPETLANLGASYTSMNENFRLIANVRISRDSVDEIFGVGFVPLDDYEVLDISAAYRINDGVEIYGRLENALDETYTEIVDFNTADRAAYAGVRVRF